MAAGDVVYEDARFRVTRWTIEPGGEIPMHRHEHEYVVVPLQRAVMHVTTAEGELIVTEMEPGTAYARPKGSEHRNENRGREVISFMEIEWIGTPG